MKKKLISTALILAALVSFNLSAQEPCTPGKACTENAACHKTGKNNSHGRKGHRPDLFKGITLTTEQQSQIEALRPARPEGKDAKAGNDKTDKKSRDKKSAMKARRGARKEYIAKVKEILTPEQYVVFLENIVSQPGHNGSRHGKKPHHRGDRTVCHEEGNCHDSAAE